MSTGSIGVKPRRPRAVPSESSDWDALVVKGKNVGTTLVDTVWLALMRAHCQSASKPMTNWLICQLAPTWPPPRKPDGLPASDAGIAPALIACWPLGGPETVSPVSMI